MRRHGDGAGRMKQVGRMLEQSDNRSLALSAHARHPGRALPVTDKPNGLKKAR